MKPYICLSHFNVTLLPLGRGGPVWERGQRFLIHAVDTDVDCGEGLIRDVAHFSYTEDGEVYSMIIPKLAAPFAAVGSLREWARLDMGVQS